MFFQTCEGSDIFAIPYRQKSNKKYQNAQIKQKIPKSSKIPKKIAKNQTKILKSSDIPQNPTKPKILKKSPNPQKSNTKPMARQPPVQCFLLCFSSSEAPDCDRVEVRYEQQSYDKMPGFFASILMGHLDVRLEVRFNPATSKKVTCFVGGNDIFSPEKLEL